MHFDEIAALRKAFVSVKDRQKRNVPPDFDEKIQKLRTVRHASVGDSDLLRRAIQKIEKNNIEVYTAKEKDEALRFILEKIGTEKLVVKSKSNVTKEIGLTSVLRSHGVEAIETDIGDRILQVLQGKPSHPTGPVAHLSAKKIAEGLSKFYGREICGDPEEIVSFMRDEISGYIEKSRIGITGANAITAEEGSIVIAHNEGNIFEVMRRKRHIVVTAIDKIYPTVEDALNMLKVICFNATGVLIPSFVEIISGVSKTADVEKKFFRGVHSPKEITLVLLDNRRTDMIGQGFRELLYCIDCGNCLLHCPMYNTIGNEFAEDKYLGGKGLAYKSISEDEVNRKLEFCLTCGKCKKHCPLSIDIPAAIRSIRSDSIPREAYYFLKSHLLWLYWNIRIQLK
ncbi:MAG: LUD domain-containing protein [Nitrospirota bacterium]